MSAESTVEPSRWNLRHPHWKAVNHYVGVEWFQDISREQAMIDAGIFVFLKLRQLILPNVYHRWRICVEIVETFDGPVAVVVVDEAERTFVRRTWP